MTSKHVWLFLDDKTEQKYIDMKRKTGYTDNKMIELLLKHLGGKGNEKGRKRVQDNSQSS